MGSSRWRLVTAQTWVTGDDGRIGYLSHARARVTPISYFDVITCHQRCRRRPLSKLVCTMRSSLWRICKRDVLLPLPLPVLRRSALDHRRSISCDRDTFSPSVAILCSLGFNPGEKDGYLLNKIGFDSPGPNSHPLPSNVAPFQKSLLVGFRHQRRGIAARRSNTRSRRSAAAGRRILLSSARRKRRFPSRFRKTECVCAASRCLWLALQPRSPGTDRYSNFCGV